MERDSFIFYKSWLNVIKDLPSDVQLEIYQATTEYALNGNLTELKPMARVAFSFMKQDIDKARENYEKKVNQNKQNGKKGGNPNFKKGKANPYYKDNSKITEDNPTLPKITEDNPNDNVISNNNSVFKNAVLNDPQYLEVTAMQLKTNIETVKNYLNKFENHLIQTSEFKKNDKEFRQHFTFWLNKQQIKTIFNPKKVRYV